MILIGYQGIKGSNSEEAAKQLAVKRKMKNYRLLPLVSSFNVLENVVNGMIDFGVIAIKNNTGGTVRESDQSLLYMDVKQVDSITLPIYHYLFVKNDGIEKEDIETIASHSQALIQCEKTLKNHYPSVELITDEDTATAAIKLRLGLFDSKTAVLCRKNAGYDNGLFLLDSHLEDREDNTTDFNMYAKK